LPSIAATSRCCARSTTAARCRGRPTPSSDPTPPPAAGGGARGGDRPLVERTRGGANGGGSSLTPTARELLARFDRLVAAYEGVARVDETVLGERLSTATENSRPSRPLRGDSGCRSGRRRDGVCDDPLRRRESPRAKRRAASRGTSVRNRFPGTVSWLEAGDAVARVGIDLESADGGDGGSDTELVALVTRRSVETLGLEPGRSIVASVKATAARGVGGRRSLTGGDWRLTVLRSTIGRLSRDSRSRNYWSCCKAVSLPLVLSIERSQLIAVLVERWSSSSRNAW